MLTFVLLATLGVSPLSYAEAIKKAEETDRPLIILIGATWCPACNQTKARFQEAADAGLMVGAIYTYIDYDEQTKVARELMTGYANSIPQVCIFRHQDQVWRRANNVVGGTTWLVISQQIRKLYIPNHRVVRSQ